MNIALIDKLAILGIRPYKLRGGEARASCPNCMRRKDDAMAVRIDSSLALWLCHRCGYSGRATTVAARHEPVPFRPLSRNTGNSETRKQRHIAALWEQTIPLSGTLGAEYLTYRGCALPPADGDVRFHPNIKCAGITSRLPAIVCRVSTAIGNRTVGIHRIYLDPNGNAPAVAKRRLGGSPDHPIVVRIFPDEDITLGLGIAEGIETALAAARLGPRVWATVDAGQMGKFPVIPGIEHLTIYFDHDAAGIGAALECAKRWCEAGRMVTGIGSQRAGEDINDLLIRVLGNEQ